MNPPINIKRTGCRAAARMEAELAAFRERRAAVEAVQKEEPADAV